MVKTKMLVIRITEAQDHALAERTAQAGFSKKSEYVRTTLFRNKTLEEKIDAIYQKVVRNA